MKRMLTLIALSAVAVLASVAAAQGGVVTNAWVVFACFRRFRAQSICR
jgi:hypothetical protein